MQKQYETIQQNYKHLITSKTYIDKLKASLSSRKVSSKKVSPKKVSPKKVSPVDVLDYLPNY
jgi:hypothetical protein